MPSPITEPTLFPQLTREAILSFQFSSWYPRFSSRSIKSTIIRPLSQEFREYLDSEGVFIPEGSEDLPVAGSIEDVDDEREEEEEDSSDEERPIYAFPELDKQIREAVHQYEGVFPKLNFTAPRDASWILHGSAPCKCTSPSEVYLMLKSSDFVLHDLNPESVLEGVEDEGTGEKQPYELELVLRKWYPVDRSRELRCFVRRETLIGISQRDPNYYEFWNEPETQEKVTDAVSNFWEKNIKGHWESTDGNYIFDFLLTRDLSRGHIIDFNPYAPRTDPLLFTYEELLDLAKETKSKPTLRVVDSRNHPAATRNAPANQHNMVPIEALSLSHGRTLEEFTSALQEEIKSSVDNDDESDP